VLRQLREILHGMERLEFSRVKFDDRMAGVVCKIGAVQELALIKCFS